MKPDLIFANAPYGKPGVDITKYIMENFPDANYAMLNTRTAFKKYYDKLACQYATIGKYLLGTNENLHWVEQAILLATNGWTQVVDNRKKDGGNMVGTPVSIERVAWNHRARNAHLVGVNEPYVYRTGTLAPRRSTHLVGIDQLSPNFRGFSIGRISHLVGMARSDTAAPAATHSRSTTLVPDDVKLRNGYIYVSFETFEEACECAIDIISWKNPTDSHYRCIRWGFVQGLVPHTK